MFDENMCEPENPDWIPKEKNLGEFILNRLKLHREKIAMIHADTEEAVTYETLLKNTISVAKTMKKIGIVKNNVILVCSKNSLNNYIPILASFLIGVKPASLDPSLSLGETIHLINISEPKIIFCEEEYLNLIEQAIHETKNIKIVVIGYCEKHMNFDSFLNHETTDDFEVKYDNDDDTAMIMFSSGSTGLPKGICLPHYGLLYQTALSSTNKRPMKSSISFYTSYSIGSIINCLSTFSKGGIFIMAPVFTVEKCLTYVEKYKFETIIISPTICRELIQNAPLLKKYNVSSLMHLQIAGEPCEETELKIIQTLFPQSTLVISYGMTEICGRAFYFDYKKDIKIKNKKITSCGRPVPGFQMKVIDLHTQKQVNKNEPGELRIKTKTIMTGYYKNKKEYEKQFDEEGYYCTGDIVYYDEDNWYYVVDRIKELIKYRSWHVTPASIESVLLTHPSVREVVVIGIPHKIDGEHPLAIIILKKDLMVSSDDIVKYVEETVPDRQRLRGGVKFLNCLPKTPSGKLKRMTLRQMVINQTV